MATGCSRHDPVVISALGETVCRQCGLVLTAHDMALDLDAKDRFAGDGQQHPDSRVGLPIDELLPNMSMRTCISGNSFQASRQRLLNTHQKIPYTERALMTAFKSIAAASHELGLNDCTVSCAKHIFATTRQKAGIRRGPFFRGLPAVCTFFAAKTTNSYRPSEMVCDAFGVSTQDFTKCQKLALDLLHRDPAYRDITATVQAPSLTTLMLNTLGQCLLPQSCHQQLRRTVLQLHDLVQMHAKDFAHCRDVTLVAAEIAVACELNSIPLPKAATAECAGVSHMTIARYIKRVRECLPTE